MKLFVTSDWHADASTSGLDRFDEIADAARGVASAAIARRRAGEEVVFACLGDLCDPDTTRSHRAVALAIELAVRLALARVPSIWIAGNHDVIENERGSTTLEPLAALLRVDPDVSEWLRVFETPGAATFHGRQFVALPYVARARAYDPAAFVEGSAGGAEYRLGDLVVHGRAPIVLGHLTVPSAERGSESDDFARGRDFVFPIEACRRKWGGRALLLNGHYHRRQRTPEGIEIPGSLARLRHDEERHEPGYLVVDIEADMRAVPPQFEDM